MFKIIIYSTTGRRIELHYVSEAQASEIINFAVSCNDCEEATLINVVSCEVISQFVKGKWEVINGFVV